MEGGAIHGGVDAEDWHLGVLELEDPAGPEAAEGGVHDEGGVAEAGEEGAAVDVVEWVAVVPGFFGVVYFEGAVWGNA